MNYFSHAHRWLDRDDCDPYWLAGLAVPDWLGVVARRTKCRTKHVESEFDSNDPRLAALARGVAQHHDDDRWFHESRAFVELNLQFSQAIVEACDERTDLRAGFLAHIVVELLLDDVLVGAEPERLDHYYHFMSQLDSEWVAGEIARMAGKPVGRLAEFIEKYVELRFIADYAEDRLLLFRLNQVMSRVRLEGLPDCFAKLLPGFREQIAERAGELVLAPPAARTFWPPSA
ncbi:hypothetical protein [Aeoliella mucimassa]|uniref:Phospholipase C/D domain-containing protein n=1 Tax=Aeoliella mucimassa TaxID=2527972 RepID=A0A518AWF3_9BACT|nr:hypothetical protein [Aeoliella mucimassa]QDU59069.1 hypothetical protein Pan181_53100 [Aeoliella mucimassa]